MRKLAVAILFVTLPCLGQNPDPCNTGYGYTGSIAPDRWYTLRGDDWKICKTGAAQSPITINTVASRRENGLPQVNMDPTVESTFKVQNTGHNLKVKELQPPWKLSWYGRTATLEEFHFHRKAEHVRMVNNQPHRYEGEIHFVFNDDKNGTKIVVAVWVNQGEVNSAIDKILDRQPNVCGTSERSPETIKIKIGDLLRSNWNNYATYEGSLTTPPCSEDVSFIITLQPITASLDQLNRLTKTSATPPRLGNVRPLQTQGTKWRP